MADSIKQATAVESALVEGGRGEFTVWVGEKQVAGKGPHGFPSDDEVLAAVERALQSS